MPIELGTQPPAPTREPSARREGRRRLARARSAHVRSAEQPTNSAVQRTNATRPMGTGADRQALTGRPAQLQRIRAVLAGGAVVLVGPAVKPVQLTLGVQAEVHGCHLG